MSKKGSAAKTIKTIRRKTRRQLCGVQSGPTGYLVTFTYRIGFWLLVATYVIRRQNTQAARQ